MQVLGVENVLKKLDPDNFVQPVNKAVQKLTLKVQAQAVKSTVVDTGRLRASIGHRFEGSKGIVSTNVDYASFVEFGTVKMESRHMEGATKLLGEGMFSYTLGQVDLGEFNAEIQTEIKRNWES